MHRIGIISDTHGLLRPEVKELLRDCEVILHAGDIDKPCILDELSRGAFIYAVRGNNDGEWAAHLREALDFKLFGLRFLMVHNKKKIPPAKRSEADIIIYGHSHKFEMNDSGGQLWLNPGSCGPRRFVQPVTMAIMEVEPGKRYRIIKVVISEEGVQQSVIV